MLTRLMYIYDNQLFSVKYQFRKWSVFILLTCNTFCSCHINVKAHPYIILLAMKQYPPWYFKSLWNSHIIINLSGYTRFYLSSLSGLRPTTLLGYKFLPASSRSPMRFSFMPHLLLPNECHRGTKNVLLVPVVSCVESTFVVLVF